MEFISKTPITFTVEPLNDLQTSLANFAWHYEGIEKQTLGFKIEDNDGSQVVELIKCKTGTYEMILKEIAQRGYIPAPTPYLLGLGSNYPKLIKEHVWITSLDEHNLLSREDGHLCFLSLSWRNLNALSLIETKATFTDKWWFAVLKKGTITVPDKITAPVQQSSKPIKVDVFGEKFSLTKSQELAYRKIVSGENVFLTGVAGTGKTFLLNALAELTKKRVYLTASTGISSLHLNKGRTISSFLGLGRYDEETASFKCRVKLDNSILVIDEISMIGISQWSYINKSIRENSDDPTSVQIIISGDLWQMPPISWDEALFKTCSQEDAVENNESIDLINVSPEIAYFDFSIVELTEIVRQNDAEFISKLMDIRYNGVSKHLHWLYDNSGNPEKLGVTLVPTRTMMNELNQTIEKGNIQSRYDLTEIEDDDRPYEILELWKDMKVIIINNNVRNGYVNGDTGKIVGFNKWDDSVLVKLDRNNEVVHVQEVKREYYREVSLGEEDQEKDYYNFMPLLPAYFLSIRRAQGCTIEYGNIHESVLGSSIPVQYTSLSRFKSIKNVYFEKPQKHVNVSRHRVVKLPLA